MFLVIVILFLFLLYHYGTRTYDYWRNRSVAYRRPIPFFGNCFYNYIQKESLAQFFESLYREFPNEPVVGFYRGFDPRIMVRDPDLIKSILSADFPHFYERGEGLDTEPLMDNPFHSDGDRWKAIRTHQTPAFTSGKLKAMFPLIIECATQLQEIVEQKSDTGKPIDARELMARFTTDFIGACGFGIKMNSMNEENSQFREIGTRMFKTDQLQAFRVFIKDLFPTLSQNVKLINAELEDSFINLVKSIIEQRNNKPIGRNDFIDLLLEQNNQGKIAIDSMLESADGLTPNKVEVQVDLKFMAAQVFVFFGAGFETSSSATSSTLHQLAHNPHIQEKVQQDIDRILAKHGNVLNYEAVKEMHYLERAFSEGLRMFPSLGFLNRKCTRNFHVPNTNIVIEKGIRIIIPVSAIHKDEKYYRNPEEFDPDRFLPEETQKRHKFVYLPFGEGPRACIGLRLGKMQSMAGLAALLHRFTFEPVPPEEGGKRNLTVDPTVNGIQSVLGGVPLIVRKRRNT